MKRWKNSALVAVILSIGCAALPIEYATPTQSPLPASVTPTESRIEVVSPTAAIDNLTPSPTATSAPPTQAPSGQVVPTVPIVIITAIPPTPTVCQLAWFTTAAPPGSCATSPAVNVQAAFQAFERGAMIWRSGMGYLILPYNLATGTQNGIVSFEPDNITIYRDTTDKFPAPPGLFAPTSGFGYVWRGDIYPEPVSNYGTILGWAIAPELGYTITEQVGSQPVEMGTIKSASMITLLTLPDGRLIQLSRLAMPNQPTSLNIINAP